MCQKIIIASFEDSKEAEQVYKFLAKGTDVEWSLVGDSKKDGSDSYFQLSTTRKEGYEIGGADYAYSLIENSTKGGDRILNFHSHSHPNTKNGFYSKTGFEGPSGAHPRDKSYGAGDLLVAEKIHSAFPKAKMLIFNVRTGKDIPYDKNYKP